MATAALSPNLHGRDRNSVNRKPFGWISRFYKRSSSTERPKHFDSDGSQTSLGGPFLGITQSQGNQFAGNEVSSLRPTISTRAPSTVSNIAVHNVEAVSSPVSGVAESFTTAAESSIEQLEDDGERLEPPLAPDEEIEARDLVNTPMLSTSTDMPQLVPAENFASTTPEPILQSNTSARSSKDSPIPSIFTARTTDTQPTIAYLAQSSVMSSHGSGMNVGASDNASMLTLASSSKGPRRRRSIDTNCSMRAIAPASARGSFESSRTGLTDMRPNGISYAVPSGGLEDVLGFNRNSRVLSDGLSARRSVSGYSVTASSLVGDHRKIEASSDDGLNSALIDEI